MSKPALFLDRDGVLNVDRGYVYRIEDFEPVDGVFDALRAARKKGYALIVVTNQSGIGRGYFSQVDYDRLEEYIFRLFSDQGVPLTAMYHCPHLPGAGCDCRKPRPGMILRAAKENDIDLCRSMMIGDKLSDQEAANAANISNYQMVSTDRSIKDILLGSDGTAFMSGAY